MGLKLTLQSITDADAIDPPKTKTDQPTQTQGIRAVFICCSVLAIVGLAWTYAFVDDTPHESLAKAENQEVIEAEQPGEVEALEDKVRPWWRRVVCLSCVCICLSTPSPKRSTTSHPIRTPNPHATQVVHGIELGVLKVPDGTCMCTCGRHPRGLGSID